MDVLESVKGTLVEGEQSAFPPGGGEDNGYQRKTSRLPIIY